jgi:hypothetical protein
MAMATASSSLQEETAKSSRWTNRGGQVSGRGLSSDDWSTSHWENRNTFKPLALQQQKISANERKKINNKNKFQLKY